MTGEGPEQQLDVWSLYDLYSNDVYRFAYSALEDSSDASDVVQEVFLRAHSALANFRRESNVKTWLMAIARNYIIDTIRKKQRDRKYVSNKSLPEPLVGSSSMDVVVEIREALMRLKPDYRYVIVLRYVDELSVRDTASVLGWSEKKVRNSSHRAMLRLRELLEGESIT